MHMHEANTWSKWTSTLRSELIVTPSTLMEVTLSAPSIIVVGSMSRLTPFLKTISSLVFAGLRTQVVAFRPFGDMLELLTSRSKMFRSHQQVGVICELRNHIAGIVWRQVRSLHSIRWGAYGDPWTMPALM